VRDEDLEVVGLPVAPMTAPSAANLMPQVSDRLPLIVFLGARRATKGVDILLQAAPKVWEHHPRAHFAFVGPGPALAGKDDRLLDVGPVSDADRAMWLSRADLLCLPSTSESFGLVVPEAWSQSTPVVASDVPVLRELVGSAGGGILARRDAGAMAEAIDSLLDDPARARAMGSSGHDYWLHHLTPDAVVARHLAIYERILRARRRSPA
jgi:glycosyltransferase involved in cell wall biosynthesis